MRAVIIEESGGPEVLKLVERDMPVAYSEDVLVDIKATAVNRADVVQRLGRYPAPKGTSPDIPGLEYAGVVSQAGSSVFDLKKGDRVYGLVPGGSYSESVVVHSRTAAKIPDSLSFEEAAAIPEAYTTAYDAMVSQCKLKAGEWVLIQAVGSGVGVAATQIARAIGALSIGTSRTEAKLEQAKEFGLLHGVLASSDGFSNKVLELAPGGVNVVLELVGGNYVVEDLNCLAYQGRIILVGLLAGASCELSLGQILRKRANIRGTTLRARPLEEKILAGRLLAENINPLIEAGLLKPVIDRVFDLKEASDAHRYMESNENFGKIILKVSD